MRLKLFILAVCTTIVGCSTTVPVVAKFPTAPEALLEKCPALKTIEGENVSIVDFTKTVTTNYTTYHECAAKVDSWVEWYQAQKKIFEEIKGN
jgi:hypothetical protein